jgi:hypothetical protein
MPRPLLLPALLAATAGCAASRAPASDDVDALSRYLFQNWEEAGRVDDAMTSLTDWLEGEGRGEIAQTEGFVLAAMTADEVGPITYPTERVPLESLVGAVVSGSSPWSIDHHAELLPMQDQTWNAPRKYRTYDRVVIEGDPALFLDERAAREREFIRTDNDVIQSRLGVTIPYTLRKDYRWVQVRGGQRAIVGRTWAPAHGCSGDDGDGANCLELSFSVDLFYENPEGDTMRMTASWNNLSLSVPIGPDIQLRTLVNGMIDVFEDTDAFLAELHPEGP